MIAEIGNGNPSISAAEARAQAADGARSLGRPDLAYDVELAVSELVTNAQLHGGGCTGLRVSATDRGIRVEVTDASPVPPVIGHASDVSLTGRGLRLVAALSETWGAAPAADGKMVWAEITGTGSSSFDAASADEILSAWADDWERQNDERDECVTVELGEVPTLLLLAAKSHVDNLVREFALVSEGEGSNDSDVPPRLRELLATVERFREPRLAIKHQALRAQREGLESTELTLRLEPGVVDDAEAYLDALDEIDSYCRAGRLLTLESPPQHRLFRRWYISELVKQLRWQSSSGAPAPRARPFQEVLLAEVDRVAAAQRMAERTSRLYAVASALASAATPEAVADAVLVEGVAALGATAGGVLLATGDDRLALPGAVGYDDFVLDRLRSEPRDAELPAAVALRTGEPVWLESRAERDARFPELASLERRTVSMCAVPLEVQGRRLGAVRFSFSSERLFDEDERRFVLTLAAQAAQALERAQLQRDRIEGSRQLQRSLLPPSLPRIDGVELAAIYHPFGDGVEVGGDFYDIWDLSDSCWGIAVGDSAGTGFAAAAMTTLVRHTLRALTTGDSHPRTVLRRLNDAMRRVHTDDSTERFCTAIAGTLRQSAGGFSMEVASGGHPPIIVRRASGTIEQHLVGGMLLGIFEDARVATRSIDLWPGDMALLYTDGVLEARRDGEMFDTAGIARVLQAAPGSAADVVAALEDAVLAHTSGELSDDMAALAVYVEPR